MTLEAHRLLQCISPQVLQLILFPTEACNFRCPYCYEDHTGGRMRPAVVRGLKRLLQRRSEGLRRVYLSWFGGEPLLALDLVEEVQEHLLALRREHPQMSVQANMTTNAYRLDRAVFERLLALEVRRFQITLDGPREVHDCTRVLADGRGTFERIWDNLLAMREVAGEFSIVVRVHIDREKAGELPALLESYRASFGADERFRLFARELSRLGGPNDQRLPILCDGEADEIVGKIRTEAAAEDLRQYYPDRATYICYAAQANSFVVRADGRLQKCTVALEAPANEVGRLHEDGRLEVDMARLHPWLRGLWDGERTALYCPIK